MGESEGHLAPVPMYIVTEASQLPCSFLEPSPLNELVIGFDCEGVDLARYGRLCIMQLAFEDAIYLVDAVEGGDPLMQACKPALESVHVTKVVHDCKRDSEALYFQYGIKLDNVIDTQSLTDSIRPRAAFYLDKIAYSLIEEQGGRKWAPGDYISFVGLLADPQYCGVSYAEKEEVRILLRKDPQFWESRPLTEMMKRAAADDVRFLLHIYHKMMGKLDQRSLWQLAVRGSLYCRCFCVNDNDFKEWPPLPSLPDNLIAEGEILEEEVLSVIDVPNGKMGRVIGKKGASILAVKECCKAEIFFGGAKGPPDKVFVVGAMKEVRKAEAIIRGKML